MGLRLWQRPGNLTAEIAKNTKKKWDFKPRNTRNTRTKAGGFSPRMAGWRGLQKASFNRGLPLCGLCDLRGQIIRSVGSPSFTGGGRGKRRGSGRSGAGRSRKQKSGKRESGNPPSLRFGVTRAETGEGFKRKGAKRSLKFQTPKFKGVQGCLVFASEKRRRAAHTPSRYRAAPKCHQAGGAGNGGGTGLSGMARLPIDQGGDLAIDDPQNAVADAQGRW